MRERHGRFYPDEANGPGILNRFRSEHWLLLLFVLHEYGLIRLLPFGVTDPTVLPPAQVVSALPRVDLTGLYYTSWVPEDGGDPLDTTMQINQAGEYLDGWLTDRRLKRLDFTAALDREQSGALLLFRGTFEGDASSWIEVRDVPMEEGDSSVIVVDVWCDIADPEFEAGSHYVFTRDDRWARLRPALVAEALPEEVVSALEGATPDEDDPDAATVLASLEAQITPLHSLHQSGFEIARKFLREDLDGIRQNRLAKKDIGKTAAVLIRTLAKARVLDTPDVPALATPLLQRFRVETQLQLVSTVLSVGLTYWAWLNQVIVDLHAAGDSASVAAADAIEELLAVSPGSLDDESGDPDALTAIHRYEFTFAGLGAQLDIDVAPYKGEGGVFGIIAPIEHLAVCAPPPPPPPAEPPPHGWPSELYYGILLEGAAGGSLGAKIAVNNSMAGDPNTAITRGEWTQDDFAPSSIHMGSATVALYDYLGVGAEVAPPTRDPGAEFDVGIDGTQIEFIFFASAKGRAITEIYVNEGWAIKTGIGLGGGVSSSLGVALGFLVARQLTDTDRRLAVRTFANSVPAGDDVVLDDFASGSWVMTPEQRELLARSTARYRALLESPEAVLRIEGSADPQGGPASNELLSWKRALATYAWLRAVLSTAKAPAVGTSSGLAVGAHRVELIGYGELEARTKGRIPDESPSPDWRRAKVLINDLVMVSL